MANVTLKYRGPLRDEITVSEEVTFGNDISDIMKYIKMLYGKDIYAMARSMLITVNGESILNKKIFKTVLHDGDIVTFLPISAGG